MNTKDITNFVMFALNYNRNFIEQAFHLSGLSDHIQRKFNHYWEQTGGYGAMIKLYSELDDGRRDDLVAYIHATRLLKLQEVYQIDSNMGGVFNIKYLGWLDGKFVFNVTNPDHEHKLWLTAQEVRDKVTE